MSEVEDYYGQVQAALWEAAGWVSAKNRAAAQHFLDHGEPAEAMRDLAHAIVEERTLVPRSLIATIRDLSSGFIPDDQMPADLDDFGTDVPTEGSGLPFADG
jgi:hypothetical protein